jgi:hypothetical protein
MIDIATLTDFPRGDARIETVGLKQRFELNNDPM